MPKRILNNIYNYLPPILLIILSGIIFYTSTLGTIVSTRPGDIKWLSILQNIINGQASLNLFPYTALFFVEFSINQINSIFLSSLITFLLLPLPAYYITIQTINDKRAGFLAGILTSIYPIYTWLITSSNYSQLQGIVILSSSIIILLSKISIYRKTIILLALSILIALADPNTTIILIITCIVIIFQNISITKKININTMYPIITIISLPLAILNQELTNPPEIYFPLVLAFIIGIAGLITINPIFSKKNTQNQFLILSSWLLSSLIAPIITNQYTSTVIYLAYPSLIASAILTNEITNKLIILTKENGENILEINIFKLIGIIAIILLILSNIITTYGIINNTTQSYINYINKYGDTDLINTLEWINQNTPRNSIILAEYPLSSWIQSYTGRTVISNTPTTIKNIEEFMKSYDADTILNANYEIRNQYIRIRDWASIAPQRSPSISSSNGENYNEFLYIDENHAKVTYTYNGATLNPDFYQYKSANSTWIKRTDTETVLQHTFILEGEVTITKRLIMTTEPLLTIEYNITSTTSTLNTFPLKIWIPWERKLGFTQIEMNTFHFTTDTGDYYVTFNGSLASLIFGPDEKWGQPRILAVFTPTQNKVFTKITIKVLNPKPIEWMQNKVIAVSAKELLAKYHISYAIIPTIVKKDLMDRFGPDYKTFKSQYENSKLTVYKVIIQ